MKITEIYIHGHSRFEDFHLDLCYPEGHARAGEPLDKFCLTGLNGAGKTALLELLQQFLGQLMLFRSDFLMVVGLEVAGKRIYSVSVRKATQYFYESIREEEGWLNELKRDMAITLAFTGKYESHLIGAEDEPEIFDELWIENNSDKLVVWRPAEVRMNHLSGLTEMPQVNFRHVQDLMEEFPFSHTIGPEKARECWTLLICLLNLRNQGAEMADPLSALAECWNELLDEVNMEFAYEPVPGSGVVDKVHAGFIRKDTGFPVSPADLSAGLRRHLFELGHLCLLFLREPSQAFLLMDQPETLLHPRFQEALIRRYTAAAPGATCFIASYNPAVIDSFDAAERIALRAGTGGMIEADIPA